MEAVLTLMASYVSQGTGRRGSARERGEAGSFCFFPLPSLAQRAGFSNPVFCHPPLSPSLSSCLALLNACHLHFCEAMV